MPEITLDHITTAANQFAYAHADLACTVSKLEDALRQVKNDYLRQLRKDVARAAEKRDALHRAISAAPHLFEKPRTLVINGIKVGYRKGTGGISCEDEAKTIALIRKHFAEEQADLLIKKTEKPIAKALADLDVATLKKIGCTVESTGDEVVIKPTNDVDKIVTALLKDATETE